MKKFNSVHVIFEKLENLVAGTFFKLKKVDSRIKINLSVKISKDVYNEALRKFGTISRGSNLSL